MNKLFLRQQKGFTLIELLVVVAIIGILSSVVITSFSNARKKAKLAVVKSEMASIIKQAELSRESDGNFPKNICLLEGGPLSKLFFEVRKNAGVEGSEAPADFNCTTNVNSGNCTSRLTETATSPKSWRSFVKVSKIYQSNTMYCVDSTGYTGFVPQSKFNQKWCAAVCPK